jgi:hypothetical protein
MHLVGVDEGSSNHLTFQVGVVGRDLIEISLNNRGCVTIIPF